MSYPLLQEVTVLQNDSSVESTNSYQVKRVDLSFRLRGIEYRVQTHFLTVEGKRDFLTAVRQGGPVVDSYVVVDVSDKDGLIAYTSDRRVEPAFGDIREHLVFPRTHPLADILREYFGKYGTPQDTILLDIFDMIENEDYHPAVEE